MRLLILLLGGGLAACSASDGPAAERRYKIASDSKAGGLCDLAEQTKQAYLKDEDAENYRIWLRKASADCALERLGLDARSVEIRKTAEKLERAADQAVQAKYDESQPVCDQPDSPRKRDVMREIGVDCAVH